MFQRSINRAERSVLFCSVLFCVLTLALFTASPAHADWVGPVYTVNGLPISSTVVAPDWSTTTATLFLYNGSQVNPLYVTDNGQYISQVNGGWGLTANGSLSGGGVGFSATFKATWTWSGSGSAPTSSVVVCQTGNVIGTPGYQASDGLGDPSDGYVPTSQGTHYQVIQPSGNTLTVKCSPSIGGGGGQVGGEITYSATAYPVTISYTSGVTASGGANYSLTGSKVNATLSGIPSSCTVSGYTWSVYGDGLLYSYVAGDGSNGSIQSGTVNPFNQNNFNNLDFVAFCDSMPESVAVTGNANITTPDNKTYPVSAISALQTVIPKVPIGLYNTPDWVAIPINELSTVPPLYGHMFWKFPVLTMPTPFASSVGNCCLIQLVSADSWTDTLISGATKNLNLYDAINAPLSSFPVLDNDMPYLYYTWASDCMGANNDNPSHLFDSGYMTYLSGSTSFQDFLMFKPTDGIWVPLQSMFWTWQGTDSTSASYASTTNVIVPPGDTSEFPEWTQTLKDSIWIWK